MKKLLLHTFFILLISILFSSCAAGLAGSLNDSAALSSNNFSYVQKNLLGKAQATYVLGIGGMNREAIVNEAKQNMLENYSLKDGQTLANTTVNFKYSNFLGLIATYKCYVTADIVQFK
ncbi:DUF6567 family protein [Flavimarina sp. Hel_I_48]|uniref:DUF6567 family protein n=1 Tax=Flavimarina sp. Hel_I_48 TaxID=1392488 RepID=UPI00068DD34A|nr:DUF6567 family protein [Flavimarina sp. Hel_I_48]